MNWRAAMLVMCIIGILLSSVSLMAQDEALNVVASHTILADVVSNVAADHANISSLIPVGADAHSFIPSPSDLTDISKADLVLINGSNYEETLLNAIESAGEAVNIVVVSACIEILPFGAAMHDDKEHAQDEEPDADDDDDHADDHADGDDDQADDHENGDEDHDGMNAESDCDEHDAEFAALIGEEDDSHAHVTTLGRAQDVDCSIAHGHDDADHGEGACDPHVWMDPHNVIYWVLMIRDTLSAADPGNAESYADNAAIYAQELVALEADFILPALEALPAEQRVLVTGHESLGYLAMTYGFEIITTIVPGMATMLEPSARDVASLIDLVSEEDVPAVFGDMFSSQRSLRTIAGEAGVEVVGLYGDTLSASDGPAATYLDYMRFNVTTIIDALNGD